MLLDGEQIADDDRANLGDATDVVPHHVDDHRVFGAVLGATSQAAAEGMVLLAGASARGGAFHRLGRDHSAGKLEEEFRGGGTKGEVARVDERGVGRGLGGGQAGEERRIAPEIERASWNV